MTKETMSRKTVRDEREAKKPIKRSHAQLFQPVHVSADAPPADHGCNQTVNVNVTVNEKQDGEVSSCLKSCFGLGKKAATAQEDEMLLDNCPFCDNTPIMEQIGKNKIRIRCVCGIEKTQAVLRMSLKWLAQKMTDDWNNRS